MMLVSTPVLAAIHAHDTVVVTLPDDVYTTHQAGRTFLDRGWMWSTEMDAYAEAMIDNPFSNFGDTSMLYEARGIDRRRSAATFKRNGDGAVLDIDGSDSIISRADVDLSRDARDWDSGFGLLDGGIGFDIAFDPRTVGCRNASLDEPACYTLTLRYTVETFGNYWRSLGDLNYWHSLGDLPEPEPLARSAMFAASAPAYEHEYGSHEHYEHEYGSLEHDGKLWDLTSPDWWDIDSKYFTITSNIFIMGPDAPVAASLEAAGSNLIETPLPASLPLALAGLAGLGLLRRKRQSRRA